MLLEMRTHSFILVAQKSFCCMKSLGLPSFLLLIHDEVERSLVGWWRKGVMGM
jgi:hypothetical protein